MDYVLWGYHPRYRGPDGSVKPIRLHRGSMRNVKAAQRQRERQGGWTLAVYRQGDPPLGLRAQCTADGH